jgi:hypothetical protein
MSSTAPLIAEAHYVLKKAEGEEFSDLRVAIFQPEPAGGSSDFEGRWLCRATLSGAVDYDHAFPGGDSLQALEYALMMVAGYIAHLSSEYRLLRPGGSGVPMEIPLFGKSLLAALLEGRLEKPLG